MTDYRGEASIGARIRAARRERGYRTTRELADALTGTRITESVLENIESGRKADLTLGQFLSIAYALRVPPSYLLAPLIRPSANLDLQNISEDLQQLTAADFDAWFSGDSAGGHRPVSAAERKDREDLDTLRELSAVLRELERLRVVHRLEEGAPVLDRDGASLTSGRIESLTRRAVELRALLATSGFEIEAHT